MAIFKYLFDYVFKPSISLVFGRAVLETCHHFGWHPDDQLAALFIRTPDVVQTELFIWITAAAIGAALWGSIALILARFRSASPNQKNGAAPTTNSTARQYSREKVERLRESAIGLRNVAWGTVGGSHAKAPLDEFRRAAEDFARQPELQEILQTIESGAQRMAIMSSRPPSGPSSADPIAQQTTMQTTLAAIERLLKTTDKHVIFAETTAPTISSFQSGEFRIAYPPREPDFTYWDQFNDFSLGQIAALWLEREPEKGPLTGSVRQKFWELHSAIYSQRLSTDLSLDEIFGLSPERSAQYPEDGEDPINTETRLGREELRRYGLAIGEKPMFLFKDMRAGRKPSSREQ